MKRISTIGLATLGAGLFLLSACGEPTPDEVRQRTSTIITRVIHETGQSIRGASEMKEVKDLVDSLQTMIPGLAGDDTIKADGLDLDMDEMDEKEAAAALNKLLATYVFIEDNVVSAGGDSITFQLQGATLCKEVAPQSCSGSFGGPVTCQTDPADLAECVKMVDQLQIRIKATLVGSDGVDLALQVGGGTLVTLRLRSDRVTVELDLDGIKAAAQHVAKVTGENIYLPQTMKGAVSSSLIINGPGDLSLQSAITRAIHVEAGDASEPVTIKAEARDPLTELRYRSSVPSLSINVDWGAVELLLPAKEVWDLARGTASLSLKGLTAKLTADKQGLTIKGVGLGQGTSAIALDGKPLVQVELQTFDMDLLPWQSLPKCVFKPGVDLKVKLNLAQLEPYVDDPIEAWALDETYSLQLGGGNPEVAPIPEQTAGFPEGGLTVLKGALQLKSHVQPASVDVPAGSCLRWSEEVAPGGHPLLGHFQSVACPQ
jgi:hypothetical protein